MTDDEWGVDRLDLDAYLRRVHYAGGLEPTEDTLRALHRAHVAAIQFENLDIMLGRGIRVELEHIQAKLVDHGRGGYCYEHGLLFAAVLQRIGYRVERLLARTGDPAEHPRPRSHLVLWVWIDGQRWLADVGFGSGLLEPLPLAAAGPHRQGEWTYDLAWGPDGIWRLRELQGADWATLMSIAEERTYWVDVEGANYNTSTQPKSPFVQRPVVVRKDDSSVRSLLGRRFTVARPDRSVEERQLTDTEFAKALLDEFGLPLSTVEVAALTATLPPYEVGEPT
jgi:N-hydroxyarylamine O-acetyltransferase